VGCWNGTCHVTNLSIRSGEEIVIFPIVGGVNVGYMPTLIPISSIEEIEENPLTDFLLKKINEGKFVFSGDYKDTKKFESLEKFCNAMERQNVDPGTVTYNIPYYKEQGVCFLMIKRDIWNFVEKKIEDPVDYQDSNLLDKLDEEIQSETPSREEVLALMKDFKGDENSEEMRNILRLYERAVLGEGISGSNSNIGMLLGTMGSSGCKYQKTEEIYTIGNLKDSSIGGLLRESLVSQYKFHAYCVTGRRDVHPPIGAGSQDENTDLIRDLAEKTFKHCVQLVKEREEEEY